MTFKITNLKPKSENKEVSQVADTTISRRDMISKGGALSLLPAVIGGGLSIFHTNADAAGPGNDPLIYRIALAIDTVVFKRTIKYMVATQQTTGITAGATGVKMWIMYEYAERNFVTLRWVVKSREWDEQAWAWRYSDGQVSVWDSKNDLNNIVTIQAGDSTTGSECANYRQPVGGGHRILPSHMHSDKMIAALALSLTYFDVPSIVFGSTIGLAASAYTIATFRCRRSGNNYRQCKILGGTIYPEYPASYLEVDLLEGTTYVALAVRRLGGDSSYLWSGIVAASAAGVQAARNAAADYDLAVNALRTALGTSTAAGVITVASIFAFKSEVDNSAYALGAGIATALAAGTATQAVCSAIFELTKKRKAMQIAFQALDNYDVANSFDCY